MADNSTFMRNICCNRRFIFQWVIYLYVILLLLVTVILVPVVICKTQIQKSCIFAPLFIQKRIHLPEA